MAYLPIDLMTSELRNYRRLKVETEQQKTAFGENSVAEPTPVVQISAQYGLTDEVMEIVNNGGSTSNGDSLFKVSSGTNPLGLASLSTSKQLAYKPGQGALTRFTSIFSPWSANSLQAAGLINSEDAFAFGYFDTVGASPIAGFDERFSKNVI